MRTLVLDKSALKAAPQGFFQGQRIKYSFLLTDTLLLEVRTEELERRGGLTQDVRQDLERKIGANFAKAIRDAGGQWLDYMTAVTYEITRGRSAKHAPRHTLSTIPSVEMAPTVIQRHLDFDSRVAKVLEADKLHLHKQNQDRIRSLGEEALFSEIRAKSSSSDFRRHYCYSARTSFQDFAKHKRIRVSPRFRPGPSWLTFGVALVTEAIFEFRLWEERDPARVRRKSPNPLYDSHYVAYISIANGILSSDKGLLKLAWACWPEKENNIYEFNMRTHEMRPFVPQWSS